MLPVSACYYRFQKGRTTAVLFLRVQLAFFIGSGMVLGWSNSGFLCRMTLL